MEARGPEVLHIAAKSGPCDERCFQCRCIGIMRDELLNETMFRNMAHARAVIRAWATDFNETRPHSALGYQKPMEFAEHLITATDTRAAPPESSPRMSVAPPAPIGVSTQRAPVPNG